MADPIPEISGATVVLVGAFNPRIFQPEWFARQDLLSKAEADNADIKVIVPQVCHFETEKYIVQVTSDRFVAASKPNASPAPLRDLVQGTFFVLEHTPVTAMGLNHQMHFATGSEEKWHRIGDMLAPKEPWKEVLDGRPGLMSLTILSPMDDPKGAQYRVRVEPSLQVPFGVFFETNEHYSGPEAEPLKSLMGILSDRWEESQNYASRVVNHILSWDGAAR
ncbi:MAG: hypothetical protein WBF56_05905 [Candidatus Acidiferrales bacterium]